MKLIIKTGSTNEHSDGCEYALVDLTPELITTINTRKATFDAMKASDDRLSEIVFHSYDAVYFDSLDEEEHEELMETLWAIDSFIPAPDGLTIEQARTECDRMVLTDYGVHFRCFPKYCDWMVTTYELDYATIAELSAEKSAVPA